MGFFSPKGRRADDGTDLRGQLARLDSELAVLRGESGRLREHFHEVEAERDALLRVLLELGPGDSVVRIAQGLLEASLQGFGLASFFLATMDWDSGLLHFHLYHEGGRARPVPPLDTRTQSTLAMSVLTTGKALYVRSVDEAAALGAYFTAAERASGLVPESYYGTPLGFGAKPIGIVSFQAFPKDAFTEARRRAMDALARYASTLL